MGFKGFDELKRPTTSSIRVSSVSQDQCLGRLNVKVYIL